MSLTIADIKLVAEQPLRMKHRFIHDHKLELRNFVSDYSAGVLATHIGMPPQAVSAIMKYQADIDDRA